MFGKWTLLFCILCFAALVFAFSVAYANPDPCLVVYPDATCIYHYDVAEYYTVGPGHYLYSAGFDRGGEVLIDRNNDTIDLSIYQAPGLIGFEPSTDGKEGYFFPDRSFNLIVDGFSNQPRTFENILVIFDEVAPSDCEPEIWVEGELVENQMYLAGDLVVSTPTPYGNNYSDVMILEVTWSDCYSMHIWAFADDNYDGRHDGKECFTAFSHDIVVPVERTHWGAIKSMYK